MCSKRCNVFSRGLCEHVLVALAAAKNLTWREYMMAGDTLAGIQKQFGIEFRIPNGNEIADATAKMKEEGKLLNLLKVSE